MIAFDTETTGLDAFGRDAPFLIALANDDGDTRTFEWPVGGETRRVDYGSDPAAVREVRRLLEDGDVTLVGHNLKFDLQMAARRLGVRVRRGRPLQETMFAAHACNTDEVTYGLKPLSAKYLDYPQDDEKELKDAVRAARRHGKKLGWKLGAEKRRDIRGFTKVESVVEMDYWMPAALRRHDPTLSSQERATACRRYAVGDVERTMLLWLFLERRMDQLDVRGIYDFEMRLWWTIWGMERRGVRVDPIVSEDLSDACRRRFDELLAQLRNETGRPDFDPVNSNHVRWLMYEFRGLTPLETTKTGLPKADALAVEQYADDPFVMRAAACKGLSKAYGTFFDKFYRRSARVRERDGSTGWRLHAGFRQTGTRTGRLSCADPNLQQVPDPKKSKSLVTVGVRDAFVARPGYRLVGMDYANMEVRVFAALSGEPNMLSAVMDPAANVPHRDL